MFNFAKKKFRFYLKSIIISISCVGTIFVGACASTNQNLPGANVTPIQEARLVLAEGMTTKQQVQQSFGLPDYVTTDQQGHEVWTYQRHFTALASQENARVFTIILYTQSTFREEASQAQAVESLMITFDANDTVTSYEVSSSIFSA